MRLWDVTTRAMTSVLGRSRVAFMDMISPGLWEGRTFRVYKEFTANIVIRFTATTDFVLDSQLLQVVEGEARLEIMTGGTPGGTWTTIPTHFNKKLLAGAAEPTFLMDFGGTHTGGVQREVLVSGGGKDNSASSSLSQGKRLLPAGTYYMRVTVTGATRGMWAVEYDVL